MKTCNVLKSELQNLVDYLMASRQVLGPKKGVKTPVFGDIQDASELVMEYTSSILPPKKFFMPPKETLLNFEIDSQQAQAIPPAENKRVLLGVHPCDMAGILLLDWAFTEGEAELNWIERRKATTIFGVSQIPDDQCFSNAVESNNTEKGYDGFFFDNGEYYTIVAYTQKGEETLADFQGAEPATNADLERGKANFKELSSNQTLKLSLPLSEIPTILKGAGKFSEWEDVASKCLSCGTCTNVCPTCYCFDVEDEVNLMITGGERKRKWDSCQLHDFSTVAGEHTFREKRSARARHRIYRKYMYLPDKEPPQYPFCTGCGRCNRACTAKINIVEIINNVCKQALIGG